MRKYIPNEATKSGEIRPRDTDRTSAVSDVLKQAGIRHWLGEHYSHGPRPTTHATEHASTDYYAVEVRVWARDAQGMAERDAMHERAVTALRSAGYLVHEGPCAKVFDPYLDAPQEHERPTILAYQPQWGGQAPEATMWGTEVATYLGIAHSTWRSYVARGQAPSADASDRYQIWMVSTIDRWRAERPGKPGRPPSNSTGVDLRPRCDGCYRPMNSGEKVYETLQQGEIICAGCCRESTTRKIAASWELP